MHHATIIIIYLLTAHSRSVCCTAYPSVRLLRLAACATDGFESAVVVAVAMHPPVCHCKYRRRLIVDRPLDIVMPCDSSRPTMSNDDLMLSMIREWFLRCVEIKGYV